MLPKFDKNGDLDDESEGIEKVAEWRVSGQS